MNGIYSAIANAGAGAGQGITNYFAGKYQVDRDKMLDQEARAQNAYVKQRDTMQIKQQALQEAARIAGSGDMDAAFGYLDQVGSQIGEPPADRQRLAPILQGMARTYQQPASSQSMPQSRKRPLAGNMVQEEVLNPETGAYEPFGDPYPRWSPNAGQAANITIQMPGENQALTKPNQNKAQQSILEASNTMRDLGGIADTYSDEFLTAPGRVKAAIGGWLDYIGASGDLVEFNANRGRFASNVRQFFNQYRKEITGAAASEKELQQLMESLFNEKLGPAEFKAMYDEFMSKAEANLQANKDAAREGVDVSGVKTLEANEEPIEWGSIQ